MTTTAQFISAKAAKGKKKQRLLTAILTENDALAVAYALRFCAQWRLEYLAEDMKQAARAAMIKAIESYKPKPPPFKNSFPNWFWLVCRDELQRCARNYGDDVHPNTHADRKKPRVKHVGISDSYSSTATVQDHGRGGPGVHTSEGFTAILGESGAQELVMALKELPPCERRMVVALARGDSHAQIAKDLGVTVLEVGVLVLAIREKLV